MSPSPVDHDEVAPHDAAADEAAMLRAKIDALERELVDQAARANAAVAEAQERTYWLDRWNLDLNALMTRRGAAELRGVVRVARGVVRSARRVQKRLGR
jgi:hypothetical protein